ncbi:hypothetical protein PHLH8_20720 [Pseudomonas sp. Pc102]|uniref:hypothetical protein n=1 Tax=Pseudomonas sp. Pc102 TaxID=2678261 RepID=UPI001BD08BB7|nr:hypothetical protein [Pseudomonas sp. Pc102]BBP82430.1 hypothetical protein PHLH8_20720 [Pseudomonas sp. Pc102]
MTWAENKAVEMIASEIREQSTGRYPDHQFGEGLIQMAYALSLITTEQLDDFTATLRAAVKNRRQELREEHNDGLKRAAA